MDPKEVLESSLDRLIEAAYHLRQMENSYHDADQFRWNLNSFLKCIKEIPMLMQMELQNSPEYAAVKDLIKVHRDDELTRYLYKQRDIVVHKEMLKPSSSGYFGITEGRGLKIGLGIPIDPLQDSDEAMMRAMQVLARTG
ncbi:hypothetical protein FDZ74_13235, partial [bacterium]